MISIFTCCKGSVVSDKCDKYYGKKIEAIYNAIIGGNTDIKEDEELQDGEEPDAEDDEDAFKRLEMFTKKRDSAAKSVDISDRLRNFRRKNDDSLDTLLHTAALFNKDPRIVALLMTCCPDLINIERTGSYKGQTALHITIAKEKMEATDAILMNLRNKQTLEIKATGSKFKNNIMMGETVLSVAVLTLNTKMVDSLLEYGAPIDQVNTKGDTVIHTLIKYAVFIPDKTPEVIKMLKHLNDKIIPTAKQTHQIEKKNVNRKKEKTNKREKVNKENKKTVKKDNDNNNKEKLIEKMWFGENNDLMTPLKLAVSAGLIEIFQAMMKLKNIFYFPNNYDGFYDTRYYDITEIDPVNQYQYTNLKKQENLQNGTLCPTLKTQSRPVCILDNLSLMEWKKTQPFVDTLQIERVISKRWRSHKKLFFLFAIIHVSVMLLFTTSIYYRKYVITDCNNDCQTEKLYAKAAPWVLVVYSAVVLLSELYRLVILKQKLLLFKHHNNVTYRVTLLLFALLLVVDAVLYQTSNERDEVIFLLLVLGCWFLSFFLKGFKKFAVYTVLFLKVIMGDLFRFGLIIGIEFAAYSFAMYIVLRGKGDVEEFSTAPYTLLTMFSYMLGLKEFSILDKVESVEAKVLAAIIYTVFIISTYILLINTLIAMMNGTSGEVFVDRYSICKLQKYTAVQFLDGFFSMPDLKKRSINDRPDKMDKEINKNEVSKFRKNRFYIKIKIDKIGKIEREKGEKKNLTLKDIKFKLLNSHTKSRQGKNADNKSTKPPTSTVNKNVKALIETEESIHSSHSDHEEFNEKDSVKWKTSLDIEYQA